MKRASSEYIVKKVNEYLEKLGYNFTRIIKLMPPRHNQYWKVLIDVGVCKINIKEMVFKHDGLFYLIR